jgi:hypothetical protein
MAGLLLQPVHGMRRAAAQSASRSVQQPAPRRYFSKEGMLASATCVYITGKRVCHLYLPCYRSELVYALAGAVPVKPHCGRTVTAGATTLHGMTIH